MNEKIKKYWKSLTAFAVGGAMCLGLGIFMLGQTTQTQLENNANQVSTTDVLSQTTGKLLLVSKDGANNNGGESKGGCLTVSQWLQVYGGDGKTFANSLNPGDSVDPAGHAIWTEIQDSLIYGEATVFNVTLLMQSPAGVYGTQIQVVGNSPVAVSNNILSIGGTTFTASAPSSSDYEFAGWTMNGSEIPANCTITSNNVTFKAEFQAMAQMPWTASGTYGTGSTTPSVSGSTVNYTAFENYTWVCFDGTDGLQANSVRWIIIGEGHASGYSGSWYVPDSNNNGISTARITNASSSTELDDGEILLFSEQVLMNHKWNPAAGFWDQSLLYSYLNEVDNDQPGAYSSGNGFISDYLQGVTIQSKNLKSYDNNSMNESINSVFLLAAHQSDSESFNYDKYLGAISGAKVCSWTAPNGGDGSSYYWLRSSYYYAQFVDFAYSVDSNGCFYCDYLGRELGVRPAFVMNVPEIPPENPDAYYLEFDSNGGGDVASNAFVAGGTLPTPTPTAEQTQAGLSFWGWCLAEDATASNGTNNTGNGTGTFYTTIPTTDSNWTPNSTLKLYAKWAVPRTVTFTADVNGTVDESSLVVPTGSTISVNGNTVTINDKSITATANSGYLFSSWTNATGTVTADMTITANFVQAFTVTFSADANGTVSESSLVVPTGSTISVSGNTVTINGRTVTAIANTGYAFLSWTNASGTVTADMTITVEFFQWTIKTTSNTYLNWNDTLELGYLSVSDGVVTSASTSIKELRIPDNAGVTTFAQNCFVGHSNLVSLYLPSSVTSTGNYVFQRTSLSSVTLSEGLISIGVSAFSNTKISTISIPSTVTTIAIYAFEWCSNLTSMTYNGTLAQWNSVSKQNSWKYGSSSITVHCTDGDITV